jgi:hypothetical protein
LVTLAFALNILDATLDAALIQFNVDENFVRTRPVLYPNDANIKDCVNTFVQF